MTSRFIGIFFILLILYSNVFADSDNNLGWMNKSMSGLNSFFGPINKPKNYGGYNQGNYTIKKNSGWVKTVNVDAGKSFFIDITDAKLRKKSDQYLVYFNLNPSSKEQVFISDYNNNSKLYNSINLSKGFVINSYILHDNTNFASKPREISTKLVNKVIRFTPNNLCQHIKNEVLNVCKSMHLYPLNADDIKELTDYLDLNYKNISIDPNKICTSVKDKSLCWQNMGRFMNLSINDSKFMGYDNPYILVPNENNPKLQYYSDQDGILNFSSPNPRSSQNIYKNTDLYYGTYVVAMDVGNGGIVDNKFNNNDYLLEYLIAPSGTMPSKDTRGTVIPLDSSSYRNNASVSLVGGDYSLYIKLYISDNIEAEEVNLSCASYTGPIYISKFLVNDIITPITSRIEDLSQQIFRKLVKNQNLIKVVTALLSLYILFYGLQFLLGSLRVSALDLSIRIIKIAVVYAMFANYNSWEYFYSNVFIIFFNGVAEFIIMVSSQTSNIDNFLGFVDPIFAKYTDWRLWILIIIQILSLNPALKFFACMTALGILIFIITVIRVVVYYIMAILTISVLISLAPIFLLFILFAPTQNFFITYMSILFQQLLLPTILLIFISIMGDLVELQLDSVVVGASWQTVIPFKFAIAITEYFYLSIPLELPFLPGIPFFAPDLPSMGTVQTLYEQYLRNGVIGIGIASIMLFFYSRITSNMLSYAEHITAKLTNTQVQQSKSGVRGGQDQHSNTERMANILSAPIDKINNLAQEKLNKVSYISGGKALGKKISDSPDSKDKSSDSKKKSGLKTPSEEREKNSNNSDNLGNPEQSKTPEDSDQRNINNK